MRRFHKKGFTLVEVLTVMVIAVPLLAILYVLLSQSLNMYDSVQEATDPIGSRTSMISDIEGLSRDCDYVELTDNILVFYNEGVSMKVDPVAYGLTATIEIDYNSNTVKINVGGEEHCVKYLQTIASD